MMKKRTYKAYVEVRDDGRAMGHILKLPGCFVKADSEKETIAKLPKAIETYCSWLKRHGENIESPDETELQVAEVVSEQAGFESGDKVALFETDLVPPNDEELNTYLRWMEYSRSDLLKLVRDIPETFMDQDPGRNRRTITQIMKHLMHAEMWYLSRLYIEPDYESIPNELFEGLRIVREEAVKRLRKFPIQDRAKFFVRDEYTSPRGSGEKWTFRKVIRRFLEHEREHTRNIELISEDLKAKY